MQPELFFTPLPAWLADKFDMETVTAAGQQVAQASGLETSSSEYRFCVSLRWLYQAADGYFGHHDDEDMYYFLDTEASFFQLGRHYLDIFLWLSRAQGYGSSPDSVPKELALGGTLGLPPITLALTETEQQALGGRFCPSDITYKETEETRRLLALANEHSWSFTSHEDQRALAETPVDLG